MEACSWCLTASIGLRRSERRQFFYGLSLKNIRMDWDYGITQTPVKEGNRLFLSGSWGVAAPSGACEEARIRATSVVSQKGFSSPILAVFGVSLLMMGFTGCATHNRTSADRPG